MQGVSARHRLLEPGITLATLPIEGYWRTSSRSSDVRECTLGASVGKPDRRVHLGDDYCNEGYEGPICDTCSRKYFKNWASLTCDPATASRNRRR